MAELVAGIGVPHSPHYPAVIAKDGPEETAQLYRSIKSHLDEVRADAVVIIANDHFNTFFMNNFPTFAIGVADASYGPNDQTKMPHYDLNVQTALAAQLRNVAIEEGFDFSVTQDFGVDHAMLVPLHYLLHDMKTPIVPIWVNAFVKPLPTARRCYALGKALRSAIGSMPGDLRVAAIASGSFSLEIGGPKIEVGKRNAVPDLAWSKHVHGLLKQGRFSDLIAEATPERMWRAGNIGGELLNWIVLLGMIDAVPPRYIADHGEKDGHAYSVWR